jgi:YD repeat-containing protein
MDRERREVTESDGPKTKFRRAKSATFSFLFCLAVVIGAAWCIWLANKPTNPYHPWFNPHNFKFEDYRGSECMMREALAKILPIGVSRGFVDDVLAKSGNAHVKEESPTRVHYVKKVISFVDKVWNVTVQYDEHGNVLDITLPAGRINSIYRYAELCKFGKYYAYGDRWK